MKDLFDLDFSNDKRPWIIIGMGPSFTKRDEYDLTQFRVLGINRVVRHVPVTICQIIDFYIYDLVWESIRDQADWLVIPYQPHFSCRPFPHLDLSHMLVSKPTLSAMSSKLLGFNLSTFPWKRRKSPVITARFFSAEAAFSILGNLGEKHVYTLGVDGGRIRADEFKDHAPPDPRGFDLQWIGINNTLKQFNMTYTPLEGDINNGPHKREASSDGYCQNARRKAS